ncbi:MAG: hypothetical protein U9Q79_06240, partial [Candidatus Hydrogenedentes bacterium]|nr:hypothetical protein [Candidatus Hydrogenedentota bacterium]
RDWMRSNTHRPTYYMWGVLASSGYPLYLYTPDSAVRRQSSWDDHGETYVATFDGPDIWIRVKVLKGIHRVGFYFINKDGHHGRNRHRDYIIEAVSYHKPPEKAYQTLIRKKHGGTTRRLYQEDFTGALKQPVLARTRVRDWWGPVYKNFLIKGPGYYLFHLRRAGSYNAVVSAVVVDRLTWGEEGPARGPLSGLYDVRYNPPEIPERRAIKMEFGKLKGGAHTAAAWALWQALDAARWYRGAEQWQRKGRVYAYRTAVGAGMDGPIAKNWRWYARIWTDDDRKEFDEVMARAWFRMQQGNPDLRTRHYRKYSPNTYETPEEWERANKDRLKADEK